MMNLNTKNLIAVTVALAAAGILVFGFNFDPAQAALLDRVAEKEDTSATCETIEGAPLHTQCRNVLT